MVASWDLTSASRDQCARRAAEMKDVGQVGDFFIRGKPKSGPPGSYGMTVRVQNKGRKPALGNFLIESRNTGFQIRGGSTPFSTLDDLVTYYSFQAREPIGVQLNNDDLYDDGLGLGLDDDDEENYGFSDEAADTFALDEPLSPISNRSIPTPDLSRVTKVELLRKQAEVLAAKRKAAELNVKLLTQHSSSNVADANHEPLTRLRMKREMAEMNNKGLLENWYKQLEEIDKIRVGTRATANELSGEEPPRTTVDGSVHRLYDEIGAYTNNSFASKVRAVEAEEEALRKEEEKLRQEQQHVAEVAVIASMVRDLLLKTADNIVVAAEVEGLHQRMASMEQESNTLRAMQEQRDQALGLVAQAIGPLFGAVGGRMPVSPPPQQQWGGGGAGSSHYAASSSAPATYQAPSAIYSPAALPTSPVSAYGGSVAGGASQGLYGAYGSGGAPHMVPTPASPSWRSAPQHSTFDDAEGPADPVRSSWSNQARAGPPPSMAVGGARVGGGGPIHSVGAPGGVAPGTATAGAPFTIVKRKIPPRAESGGGGVSDIPCSYLGNCQCPRCR